MERELADLLNRLGLVAGFAAFWFAAPEFIGEERLKSWEQALALGLIRLPSVTRIIMALVTAGAAGTYVAASVIATVGHHALSFPAVSATMILTLGIVNATAVSAAALSVAVLPNVVARLANDTRVRQRALALGALLFTLSFVLQFLATFQNAPLK